MKKKKEKKEISLKVFQPQIQKTTADFHMSTWRYKDTVNFSTYGDFMQRDV